MIRVPAGHERRIDRPSRIHLIPALTGLVFLRRDIGGRILLMVWVLPLGLALFLIQPLSGRSLDDPALRIFALAFLALALLHRVRYEVAKARGGVVWHSLARGTSWLSFLPLPTLLIHLIIDPALFAYLGWRIAPYSQWLGFWMMTAAGMLFLTELHDYRHAYHRDHDIIDGEVESRLQAAAIQARRAQAEDPARSGAPAFIVRAKPRPLWRRLFS